MELVKVGQDFFLIVPASDLSQTKFDWLMLSATNEIHRIRALMPGGTGSSGSRCWSAMVLLLTTGSFVYLWLQSSASNDRIPGQDRLSGAVPASSHFIRTSGQWSRRKQSGFFGGLFDRLFGYSKPNPAFECHYFGPAPSGSSSSIIMKPDSLAVRMTSMKMSKDAGQPHRLSQPNSRPSIRPNSKYHCKPGFFPVASTPELADDECSGDEDFVLERIQAQFGRLQHRLDRSNNNREGRVPPEGRDKVPTAARTPRWRKNLSGELSHDTPFRSRSESVESSRAVNLSGMSGLIEGAREVRRLIREASFDSTTSEWSLSTNFALPDDWSARSSGRRLQFDSALSVSRKPSDWETDDTDDDLSNLDPDKIREKCLSSQKHKKLWYLSAPMNLSDFDSPEHAVSTRTGREPWSDRRSAKYKMALFSSQQPAGSGTVSELSDPWEWDSDDNEQLILPGTGADDSGLSQLAGLLPDNLELDLEAELCHWSNHSSRRNSLSSDLDSCCLYRNIRLPPSGRSSVSTTGFPADNYHSSSDQDQLKESLDQVDFPPRPFQLMVRARDRRRREPLSPDQPIFLTSSTSSGSLLMATTPLSPVHEAKEESQKKTPSCQPSPSSEDQPGSWPSPAVLRIQLPNPAPGTATCHSGATASS